LFGLYRWSVTHPGLNLNVHVYTATVGRELTGVRQQVPRNLPEP
jgi:hypothetical protein